MMMANGVPKCSGLQSCEYCIARYRYSPVNGKVHFGWKPQRTRANRTGNQR